VPQRGLFLTFEGVDGAGKSTHIATVVQHLKDLGLQVVQTREPGGTPLGEELRRLLLKEPMRLETETLLMFAARNEHIQTVIDPALARGHWVVCDRFTDATFAYQGAGRELGAQAIAILEDWVHPHLQPDRTWFFDVALDVARQRLDQTRELDRFEREGSAFFERTRQGYWHRVQQNPARFDVIDGSQSIEEIAAYLREQLTKLAEIWREGVA
jgi:dTMP kinase